MLQSVRHYLYIVHLHTWLCLMAALKVEAHFHGANCGDRFLPHDPHPNTRPPASGVFLQL